MSLLKLPKLDCDFQIEHNRIDDNVFSRWREMNAKSDDDEKDNVITIYDPIGKDFFGEGFTVKRMSAALRSIGKKNDVVVSINSPGGDFFEGMAVYNLLVEHEGKVTVKIPGIAASAASLIAMAGDKIEISKAGFLMVHAVWGVVIGNRHDMEELAEVFKKLDNALADVYESRSGIKRSEIEKMLKKDTWMNGSDAVDKGFADDILPVKSVKKNEDEEDEEKKATALARRNIENALAGCGYSRSKREEILKQALGARDAVQDPERDAGLEEAGLKDLLNVIKN